jgi:nicotinamidase-related amidase
MTTALIAIGFINDILSAEGKLAGKGYHDFAKRHKTIDQIEQLLDDARTNGVPLFHVGVGFSDSYIEHPANSPLLGPAKKFGALVLGESGTEFVTAVAPVEGEKVIHKHRVSAFHGTPLETILRARDINRIVIVGVATDLAVAATALAAHDRDFQVVVIGDCCIAANDADHEAGLVALRKIGNVFTRREWQW